jgi:hypothetical protein
MRNLTAAGTRPVEKDTASHPGRKWKGANASYVIKAVLSNPRCPGYGLVTVPFPIPDQEYDQMMELLSGLEIGDALERDCQVNEQDSWYDVLGVLEGMAVNVDELDYLAKRLDSFCDDEAEQFQAMAHKLGLTDIRDFINLTFCCERVTVISDFSKLEEAGRNYRMSLNGGSMPMDELKALDGRKEALRLIAAGGGTVTPYGVVYDNGMELEQLYDGRHFPAYFYDASPLALAVTSKREPGGKPEYLFLPASEQKIQRTLLRAGVREDPDLQLRLECDELPEQISFAVDLEHLEQAGLTVLNQMCWAIKALCPPEQKKLEAAAMLAMPHGPDEVCRLAENLSQFDFVPDIKTPEEYGRYMIQESGHFEYDENLEGFYDFLGYGLQKVEKEQGRFNDLGYIAYHGALTLDELLREDPAEQYQREQGPKMGGPL